MAKLSNLRPKLSSMGTRLTSATPLDEADRSRGRRQDPMFRLYGTARWKKLRQSVLIRDLFTCAKCGRMAAGKGQAVVDHKKPHRGSGALFWCEGNLQVLCKSPCHDSVKQREEQSDIKGQWY